VVWLQRSVGGQFCRVTHCTQVPLAASQTGVAVKVEH
jgi:hypothetical protein